MFLPSWTSVLPTVAPLVVIAVLAVVLVRRGVRTRARRQDAVGWPSAPGVVLQSGVQSRRVGNSRHEYPVVVYTYQVGGAVLTGTRVRVGDELGTIAVAGDAGRTVARYRPGTAVQVFYDPADPTRCALER